LSVMNLLRHLYLSHASSPAYLRPLIADIRRRRPVSLVDIGLYDLTQTATLLAAARCWHPVNRLRYTGIDPFEMRPNGREAIGLKQAHRQLAPMVGRVRLVPGDPLAGLARAANSLLGSDLLIIADLCDPALDAAWMYVPRMLHDGSRVWAASHATDGDPPELRPIPRAEIEQRAASATGRRRAA